MSTVKKLSGVALAAAAATLFVAGCATGGEGTGYKATGKVACEGVNGCKGLSECKTASNDCKGKNSCKGQGFEYMVSIDCWRAQQPQHKPM